MPILAKPTHMGLNCIVLLVLPASLVSPGEGVTGVEGVVGGRVEGVRMPTPDEVRGTDALEEPGWELTILTLSSWLW